MSQSLPERIAARSRAAQASGALQPLTTRVERVADAGAVFRVHVLDRAAGKPRAAAPGPNPFLDPEPELVIGDVGPGHRLILNKFKVLSGHALLVTRAFEDQRAPLALADFAALVACLAEIDALAFYNAGPLAGASQPHRHLQLVPLPLGDDGRRLPLEPGVNRELPFRHACGRFGQPLPPPEDWLAAYQALRRGLRLGDAGYNLLATREWMMLVPRPREAWEGIGVNALGFAGLLLVHEEAQLATLRRVGPLRILQGVAE